MVYQVPYYFHRSTVNEKESDKFQQYKAEKNPWLSFENVHQRGKTGPESKTREGKKAIDRIIPKKRSMQTQSFRKHVRIRKRRDYVTVYQQGVRSNSKHFTIIACKNQVGISRLGITVSKKVGSAVKRNRIKRLVREFFRLHASRLSTSQDFVIIAKKDASLLKYDDVCRELGSHLIRKSGA